jgi:glutamine amidotransferase
MGIVIVDYGMGNLRSVQKAFERIRIPAKISADANDILSAEKLILPGVGHFKMGIYNLASKGLIDPLNRAVLEKKIIILGICLGMQLMTEFSEEGNVKGLGWIKAQTKRFSFASNEFKVPHMGWDSLSIKNGDTLYKGINQEDLFYFVHSYFIICEDEKDILTETYYGQKFVSSFNKDNIYGFQFHPEKSHNVGLKLLKNFANFSI